MVKAQPNNSMDVRAKQRLCLLACLLNSELRVAVSPHVISTVRCFLVKTTVDILLPNMNDALAENPNCIDEAKFLALALAEFQNVAYALDFDG